MDFTVDMAEVRPFKLNRAVLIYEETGGASRAYASVHDVAVHRIGARPVIGAGVPVNKAFITSLISSLGQELTCEYLPDLILYRTHDVLLWWTPAATRMLFFRPGCELEAVSGEDFPTPPLVWCLRRTTLYVRALAENTRPQPTTELCVAPFWNTSAMDGRICQGTMARPDESNSAAVDRWVESYFRAQFTHQDGSGQLTKHPGGHDGLWKSLAGKKHAFPLKQLVPAEHRFRETETLHAFASGMAFDG